MRLPNIQSWFEGLTTSRIFLVLAFMGLLAYANAVNHPFVHDDVLYIQHNPRIADFDIKNFFEEPAVQEAEFTKINQYYRPLLEYINKALFKLVHLNPHGFHFFNILLHIANAMLVYLLIHTITEKRKGIAFFLAGCFLLHPIQSEAVACISGISNLVFAFFTLASFYVYLKSFSDGNHRPGIALYISSLVLFAMALLSKEQAVVLPVLILAYELCRGGISKGNFKKAGWVGGFFILLLAYFLMRKLMFGSSVTQIFALREEYFLILLSIPRSILIYLSLMIAPRNLHYYRSLDVLEPYAFALIVFIILFVAAVYLIARTPKPHGQWMAFGLAWFAITLAPASNIVPLVNEFSLILIAEHFLYMPIIGFLLYIVGLSHHWLGKKTVQQRFTIYFIGCIVLWIVYFGMTVKQNTYWRGEIPLFERTLKFQKNFGRVRFLLGQAYARVGHFEKAIEEDLKALTIMEGYAARVQDPEIRKFYLIFIRQIYHHLGVCYERLSNMDKALVYYANALQLAPENIIYNYSVGNAYLKLNKIGEAIPYYEAVFALNKNDLQAANSLGICYEHIGKMDEAEKYLRHVAEQSGSPSAKDNLNNFLKRKRNAVPEGGAD